MKKVKPGFFEWLLGLLFPPSCLLCGKRIPAGRALCQACEREKSQKPLERLYNLPGSGRGLRVLSPFAYEGGCRRSLHQLKFRGQKALARPFGRMMAEMMEPMGPFDGVVWSPMTDRKKRQRGYDQSQLLAEAVAKALGVPCLPLLRKVRETKTQHELSRRERAENVKLAYEAKPEAAGKALLLVDDIVTTGATMAECAGALYRAGAKAVVGLCAADASWKGDRE